VRIAAHAAITGSWLRTGEGNYASHRNDVFGRQRVLLGVTYAH